jgi:hypothetical protein
LAIALILVLAGLAFVIRFRSKDDDMMTLLSEYMEEDSDDEEDSDEDFDDFDNFD